MQRVYGVDHELQESVPEVRPGVEDRDAPAAGSRTLALAGHHPAHGRPRHASLFRKREKKCFLFAPQNLCTGKRISRLEVLNC